MRELGLLLWPVADCNLSNFLQQTQALYDRTFDTAETSNLPRTKYGSRTDFDLLWKISEIDIREAHVSAVTHSLIYIRSLQTLKTYFGCLATVLASLHQQNIQHRDLKLERAIETERPTAPTGFTGLTGLTHDRSVASDICQRALYIRALRHL